MLGIQSHSLLNSKQIGVSSKKTPFTTRFSNKKQYINSTNSPTVTDDKFANECDINLIVWKHQNGIAPIPTIDNALYNQFDKHSDFGSFVNQLHSAQANFNTLPSKLRLYFDNDVSKFAHFLNDSKNTDADLKVIYEKLGISKKVQPIQTILSVPDANVDVKSPPINPNISSENTSVSGS